MDEIGWPECGEIGVARIKSAQSKVVNTGIYSDKIDQQADQLITNLNGSPSIDEEFHVYTLFWEEDRIRWFLDGMLLKEVKKNSEDMNKLLEKSFFVTLNLAVGGSFAGDMANREILPTTFEVDYIRIFGPERFYSSKN
jgi:beta-glucanase (GH16 family)